jgi:hypothetical protein
LLVLLGPTTPQKAASLPPSSKDLTTWALSLFEILYSLHPLRNFWLRVIIYDPMKKLKYTTAGNLRSSMLEEHENEGWDDTDESRKEHSNRSRPWVHIRPRQIGHSPGGYIKRAANVQPWTRLKIVREITKPAPKMMRR